MTLLQILGVFGGSTLVATGIATFLGTLIQKRIAIAWQEKANRRIVDFKEQMENQRLRIESVLSHYSGIYAAAQSERIKATNALWAAVLKVREVGAGAVFFYTILSPNEYDKALNNPSFRSAAYKTQPSDLTEGLFNVLREVELLRPLVGERLWSIFSVYGSFTGRLAYKLRDQADKGHILPWHDDKGIQQFIKVLFTEDEQARIDYATPMGLRTVVSQIETKIAVECSNIIAGSAAVTEGIEETERIRTLLETYGIDKQI